MKDKLLFIIVMIIALYLSISVIQRFSVKYDLLSEIIKEFQTGYIEDIIITNSTTCPQNLNPLVIDTYWPGSYKGCGCKSEDGSNIFNFFPNYCPRLRECYSVEETTKKDLFFWRGFNICFKRSNITYAKLNLTKSNKDEDLCNNKTHKTCGIIDGRGNSLCLQRELNCPITEIRIEKISNNEKKNFYSSKRNLNEILQQNKTIIFNKSLRLTTGFKIFNKDIKSKEENLINPQNQINEIIPAENPKLNPDITLKPNKSDSLIYLLDTNITSIKDNNTKLKLNDNYYILFNREHKNSTDISKSNQIPVFFRLDMTVPCLDTLKKPSSEHFFPLMKNKFDYMCDLSENKTEILDEHLYPIDSLILSDFYKDNNILDDILKITNPFNINLTAKTMNLYTRSYLGWNINCIESNPDSLNQFLKIEENLNGILISNIVHSFISIGGIIALGVFACFLSKYFEILFKFVNLGFCVLNLIYPIQIITNSNWLINLFTDEDGVFCGDNMLNTILIEISNSCLEMQSSYILIFWITVFYSL